MSKVFTFLLEVFPAVFLIEELTEDEAAELGMAWDELKPETKPVSNREWLV